MTHPDFTDISPLPEGFPYRYHSCILGCHSQCSAALANPQCVNYSDVSFLLSELSVITIDLHLPEFFNQGGISPRCIAHLTRAARCPISMAYHWEVMLESCLWRGYIPAEEIYALARCPVSMVYHREDVLEYYLCRGYIPAGGTYALGSLSNPRRCLAAAAERASIKQKKKLHTTLQH